MSFEFPNLPYSYDALEPHFDAMTMEIHHSRHHKTYHTNFTNAIQGTPLAEQNWNQIFASVSKHPLVIRNHGGGHYNHTFFWNCLAPKAGGAPTGKVADAINKVWGSFDAFKEKFNTAAAGRFGSGFAWLIVNSKKELEITSTANQDNPLMDTEAVRGTPVLALDVWEHAYYLKYQNKRPDYINAFWNIVNWKFVNEEFEKATR